jgi:hypothetical protein
MRLPTLALHCEADLKADTANPRPSLERTGWWLNQANLDQCREAGIGANRRKVSCSHIDSAPKVLGEPKAENRFGAGSSQARLCLAEFLNSELPLL